MTRRERAYNRRLQGLIDGAGRLEDRAVARVISILENARKEVAAQVAVTEWDMYHLPQLKEGVERAMEGFRQQYLAGQTDHLANSFNAGIDIVDGPLHYAGIRSLAPELSREALEVMQGYSADLINGLSADALKKINSEISLGVMGAQPQHEVMARIGRNLEDKSVFKSIGHRAEAITRTETGRVQSAAREARMQATAGNTEPEMAWLKKWISSGKAEPRPHHAALHNTTVGMDEDFPGGLPYPHAPGLPAAEVVHCG